MNFLRKTIKNLTSGKKKNMGYFLLALVIIFFVLWLASRYAYESFSSGEVKIVYFRMEGCPYCEKFDPVWREFSSGRSDCMKVSSSHHLVKKIRVTSFPTICKVRGETKIAEFSGERTVVALASWAK